MAGLFMSADLCWGICSNNKRDIMETIISKMKQHRAEKINELFGDVALFEFAKILLLYH